MGLRGCLREHKKVLYSVCVCDRNRRVVTVRQSGVRKYQVWVVDICISPFVIFIVIVKWFYLPWTTH